MKKINRLLFRVKRKMRKKLKDVDLFRQYLSRRSERSGSAGEKSVWIDLHGNSYVRYLYILVKYFEAEGYRVYLNENLPFLLSLGDDYSRFIVEECSVRFSSKVPDGALVFSDRPNRSAHATISNDYFLQWPAEGEGHYHIPIGMHPFMYKYGYWNAPYDDSQRKRSVFFAGNFDATDYKIFSSTGNFRMLDRLAISEQVCALKQCRFPQSEVVLRSGFSDGVIDIVDKKNFSIDQRDLRGIIAQYSFFIACPGVFMPLSHNIYEAMSVGTIPIIHEEYAALFAPALQDGVNAVVFHNGNFSEKLQAALALDTHTVAGMVEQVKQYYERYCTPKAIVAALASGQYSQVYLNAEKTSIRLLTARQAKLRTRQLPVAA
ncbi:MAG: hypothetical protein EOO15_12885 [Chitinophagaceae bacterium]|nr:MAG: hypothetical protein EOO15_12885 [Chitinophagaceae bacterium]